MNKNKLDPVVIGTTLFSAVLLFGTIYLGIKNNTSANVQIDSQVSLVTSDTNFDWGTIDIDGGMAVKNFDIKNEGTSVLKLYNVKTSCTCTSAQLKSSNRQSPKFKMHDQSSYVMEVNPGETAQLIVEFDPLFHGPNGVGQISRTISMNTNDPNHPELSFNLTANVIKN